MKLMGGAVIDTQVNNYENLYTKFKILNWHIEHLEASKLFAIYEAQKHYTWNYRK